MAEAADLASAYAHCEALLREADRDDWLATLFAPADIRPRLHALGAFAVEIGAIRTRVHQPLAGEIRIQWWQDVIDGGRATEAAAHPVAAALLDTVGATCLPREPFGEMLDAHRLMLYDDPPPDLAALEQRLAATRGVPVRLAALVLGGEDAAVAPAAAEAGIALGLDAMLRELGDGGRRVVLPAEMLRRQSTRQGEIDAGRATDGVRAVLAEIRHCVRARLANLRGRRRELGPAAPAFLTTALVEPRLRRGARAANPCAPVPDLPAWRRQIRLWRASRRGGVL